jgi:hypothetical protein
MLYEPACASDKVLQQYEFETELPPDAMKWTFWDCLGTMRAVSDDRGLVVKDLGNEENHVQVGGKTTVFYHFAECVDMTLDALPTPRLSLDENGFFDIGFFDIKMAIFKPGQDVFREDNDAKETYDPPPLKITTGECEYAAAMYVRPNRPFALLITVWKRAPKLHGMLSRVLSRVLLYDDDDEANMTSVKYIRSQLVWDTLRGKVFFISRLARALTAWYGVITVTPPHGKQYIESTKRFKALATQTNY